MGKTVVKQSRKDGREANGGREGEWAASECRERKEWMRRDEYTAVVNAQLVPRHDLHQLLERAITSRQSDEARSRTAGQYLLRHHLLAGVHVLHDRGASAMPGSISAPRNTSEMEWSG